MVETVIFPYGRHDLHIVRNGTYFTLDVDGHRDEDFPIGPLLWPKGDKGEVKSGRITDVPFFGRYGEVEEPQAEGAKPRGDA